jgi:hypothetical protein
MAAILYTCQHHGGKWPPSCIPASIMEENGRHPVYTYQHSGGNGRHLVYLGKWPPSCIPASTVEENDRHLVYLPAPWRKMAAILPPIPAITVEEMAAILFT